MNQRLLRYRAGPRALRRLRAEGLGPGTIGAVVGPASGPKWVALVGLDRALLESDLLRPSRGRILLAGASAGAWRMLAFACRDPLNAHRALLEGYVSQVFRRRERPAAVSDAYRRLLADILDGEAGGVLDHPTFDLAVHTTRVRYATSRMGIAASLAAAAALNLLTRRATGWLFERVLFSSRPERFAIPFDGDLVRLEGRNLLAAALASGTVPLYLEAVRDPAGAAGGAYVDGGLADYHLNQRYLDGGGGVVLLPHYRRRVVARWLDKGKPRRRPPSAATRDLLQIYPSTAFVAGLPGGRLPDRDDFKRFVDAPEERIRRWRAAAAAAEALGEELLADLEAGRVPDLVEPFDGG